MALSPPVMHVSSMNQCAVLAPYVLHHHAVATLHHICPFASLRQDHRLVSVAHSCSANVAAVSCANCGLTCLLLPILAAKYVLASCSAASRPVGSMSCLQLSIPIVCFVLTCLLLCVCCCTVRAAQNAQNT